jgi:uncharacterized SAM-binding protein YcdF (DUF218 family)
MRGAARAWIVDEEPVPSDVIVVLAGSLETRPHAAAKLYHAEMAPKILMTDIPAREGLETPGVDYASGTLMMNGVPRDAIVIQRTGVTSTIDEANAVLAWCNATGATKVLVVTDPFHTRRVRWIFGRIFEGHATEVRVVASEPVGYDLDRWWQSEFALIEFNNELVKYAYYQLKYRRVDRP